MSAVTSPLALHLGDRRSKRVRRAIPCTPRATPCVPRNLAPKPSRQHSPPADAEQTAKESGGLRALGGALAAAFFVLSGTGPAPAGASDGAPMEQAAPRASPSAGGRDAFLGLDAPGMLELPPAVTPAAITLQPEERAAVSLFRESTPSVVYVTNLAVRRDTYTLDVREVPQGTGSGFVWDRKGHVVTNYHVIRGASDLRVTLGDQSAYAARVVGYDEDKDVAVLKIDAPGDMLRPLAVGSSGTLLVGQKVFAIGNPFGLDHTLTTGVVSGLGREIESASGRPIQGVIQTDAAINPGNSGGPLLNSAGQLIGINTAIFSPSGASSGVGFAIPSDTVAGIVNQIIAFGKVTRPVIGINFAPDPAVAQLGFKGVLVLDAPKSGPAGRAGLRSTTRDEFGRLVLGDVIVDIDGKAIANSTDLFKVLDTCKVGQTITVTVVRGVEKVTVPITLDEKK